MLSPVTPSVIRNLVNFGIFEKKELTTKLMKNQIYPLAIRKTKDKLERNENRRLLLTVNFQNMSKFMKKKNRINLK